MLGWTRAAVEKDCRGTWIIVKGGKESQVRVYGWMFVLGLGKGKVGKVGDRWIR